MGHAGAQYEVAMSTLNNESRQQWLHKAAVQGHSRAQTILGKMLLADNNENEAIHWLSLAAVHHENKAAILQLVHLYNPTFPDKALSLCTRFLQSHPNDIDINYYVGLHWFLNGDSSRATEHLENVVASISAVNGQPSGPSSTIVRMAHRKLARLATEASQHDKAHEHYKQAVLMGDTLALGMLGHQFEHGIGCQRDVEQALECYRKAANDQDTMNRIPAQMALGTLLYELNRPDEAIAWFEKLASSTVSNHDNDNDQQQQQYNKLRSYQKKAECMVASYRLEHVNNPEEQTRALEILESLAADKENECVEACIALAEHYEANNSTKKALDYLCRAANLGDANAQFLMAQHVEHKDEAYTWYKTAAAQGHSMAQLHEALYHLDNSMLPDDVTPDLDHAEKLLRNAANAGISKAMVHLASMEQMPDDESIQWLQKAAALDNTEAMRKLSNYHSTLGEKAALGWLQKAAVLNDAQAWYQLGQCYMVGSRGLTKNTYKATECMKRAETFGCNRAGFTIASLYENDSKWDLAIEKYTAIANDYPSHALQAHLAKCRLVVIRNIGDYKLQQESVTRLADTLKTKHDDDDDDDEILIEAWELLGICHEHGYGTQASITDAIDCYSKATLVNQHPQLSTQDSLHYIQERTRCRLAAVLATHHKSDEALLELQKLEPYLDRMRGHQVPSETVTQAREARFLYGTHQKGLRWLQEAADQGHTQAIYELGKHALEENRDTHAKSFFRKGDVLGHAGCKRELALMMMAAHDENDNHDYDYRDLLETAADMGDSEAMFQCGLLYQFSNGKNDLDLATQYYLNAATHGHPFACVYAGYIYYLLHRNEQAIECFILCKNHWLAKFGVAACGLENGGAGDRRAWLQEAEEATPIDPSSLIMIQERRIWCEACEYLGQCYETIIHDKPRAIEWYTLGADLAQVKYIPAMLRLAQLAENEHSDTSALEWYRIAADCGDTDAKYHVGLFHQMGRGGLEVNLVVAAAYFREAQANHHIHATYALAQAYWELKDYQRGWNCYKEAADRHAHVDALRAVGLLYMRGLSTVNDSRGRHFSIEQDHDLAMSYFSMAARQNDEASIMLIGSYFERAFDNDEENKHTTEANMEGLNKALAFYEKAYVHKIANPVLEFVIGRLHQRMGNMTSCSKEAELHYKAAYRWFKLAVDQQQTRDLARIALAYFHLYGWVPEHHNPSLGFDQLLIIELETGDVEIIRQVKMHIAQCYQDGTGVQQDSSMALLYWKQLCALDFRPAMHAVEALYADGLASQQDVDSAREYFNSRVD
ncbi:HCP-like protein [Lichtheimia hyalospora FSU 10163]|nr:HCP-like protein [Lichtheimia hyalospora FSU 10163]